MAKSKSDNQTTTPAGAGFSVCKEHEMPKGISKEAQNLFNTFEAYIGQNKVPKFKRNKFKFYGFLKGLGYRFYQYDKKNRSSDIIVRIKGKFATLLPSGLKSVREDINLIFQELEINECFSTHYYEELNYLFNPNNYIDLGNSGDIGFDRKINEVNIPCLDCILNIKNAILTKIPYNEFNGIVWENEIKPFNVLDVNFEDLDLIHNNPTMRLLKDIATSGRKDNDKINSLKAFLMGIAYAITPYKNKSIVYAPFFIDMEIPKSKGDSNGGTGKGLVSQLLECFTTTCKIKDYNPNFPYQSVSPNHRLIIWTEAGSDFPFKKTYNDISDGITLTPKYKDAIVRTFGDSPKQVVCTNSAPPALDPSTKRRVLIYEFPPLFSDEYPNRPIDIYKTTEMIPLDFSKWEYEYNGEKRDGWLGCIATMVFAIITFQDYEKSGKGILRQISVNANERTLLDQTNETFTEFVNDIELNIEHNSNDLFNRFTVCDGCTDNVTKLDREGKLTKDKFRNMLEVWCKTQNLDFIKRPGTTRERIKYWTFKEKK